MTDESADPPGAPVTTADGAPVAPRIQRLRSLAMTPRRVEMRRLAAAGRAVIEQMCSTGASVDELAAAADQLEEVAAVLAAFGGTKSYEGFAESANAGAALAEIGVGADGAPDAADAEQFAFFDHSPFIGLANPMSPPMVMELEPNRVTARVNFGSAYEGPPGCVHGGYIAAAFDELLGSTQSLSGNQGMTARLTVNYRSPTPLHTDLLLVGELTRTEGRKIFCEGRLFDGDRLCAESDGLFITFVGDAFRALLEARQDRLG